MINRRAIVTAGLAAIAGAVLTRTVLAQSAMSRITAYVFSFPALAGDDIRLAEYTGRPMLVVNTASLCGFTPQYVGLQELWTQFRERGLVIIGIPSNDFGGQEPGGATEIAETANHQYGGHLSNGGKSRGEGARMPIRSTNGPPKPARRMFRAGTFTSI
jgi:glutathione peroxidase